MTHTADQTSRISFYSLLYIEENEQHTNLKGKDDPILVYLLCGALLNKSLQRFGHELKIVTNEPEVLARAIDEHGLGLTVVEISFSTFVPPTLNFRSAHRKLDLIAAFGSGAMGPRPGLLDLDMIFLRQLPLPVFSCDRLVGYNIWSQVAPAYGPQRIRNDVAQVSGIASSSMTEWWGGEFLVGPKDRFAELSREIERIYPRYLKVANGLHHQGDEIVVTSALHTLSRKTEGPNRKVIVDGGQLEAIGRWWSTRTLSRIEPLSMLARRSILHVPADKEILSELYKPGMEMRAIAPRLLKLLRGKTRLRRLLRPLNVLTPFFSNPRKHSPRM